MLLNEKCIQTGRELSPNVKEMTDGEVSAILVEGDLSPKEPPKEREMTDEEVSAILKWGETLIDARMSMS